MTTGFNTEFRFNERLYHVQTEDKGVANPVIQTLVYVRGEILDSLRRNYSSLLTDSTGYESEVLRQMQTQHQQVVSDIKNGKYDFTPNDNSSRQKVFNNRPMEDAIVEYLQKDGDKDILELILQAPLTPKFDSSFVFLIKARLCVTKAPIQGADVSVKFISGLKKAFTLKTGKTDEQGMFGTSIKMPNAQPGNCAVVVSCASEHGSDEVRVFVSL
jgi:hypothetical protein